MVLRPNVKIETQSSLGLIAQGGPATIAIMGTAQWGPIGTVTDVSNFNDALTTYKEDLSGSTLNLIKGLDLLYSNGAGNVKIVRIADTDAAKSTLDLAGTSTTSITLSGKYEGTYGDNIMATVTVNADIPTNRDVQITDGSAIETYDNGGTGYSSNTDIITDINSNSNLVTAAYAGDSLIAALSQTNLSGGDDGADGIIQSDYTTVLDGVLYSEDYNILVVPGETDDAIQTAITGRLNTRAGNDDLYAVYFSGIAVDETIVDAIARTASGKRFALIAPNVKYNNRVSGTEQVLDGSFLACAYAGATALGWPEVSATHKTLTVSGLSILESSGKEYYNNSEQEKLLKNGIVPVTKISNAIQPARAVTKNSSTTEVWYEQNIVNIVDYVKAQVLSTLNPFIGKPNLERIRSAMAKNVDGILEQNKRDEVIADYLSTEVTISSGSNDTVNVSITIQPTFLVNFINVTLTLDNTSN